MSKPNGWFNLPQASFETGATERFLTASSASLGIFVIILLNSPELQTAIQNASSRILVAFSFGLAIFAYPIGFAIQAISFIVIEPVKRLWITLLYSSRLSRRLFQGLFRSSSADWSRAPTAEFLSVAQVIFELELSIRYRGAFCMRSSDALS